MLERKMLVVSWRIIKKKTKRKVKIRQRNQEKFPAKQLMRHQRKEKYSGRINMAGKNFSLFGFKQRKES